MYRMRCVKRPCNDLFCILILYVGDGFVNCFDNVVNYILMFDEESRIELWYQF